MRKEKEHKTREECAKKLKSFLINPGNFSILILGRAGTGKSYIIDLIAEDIKEKYSYGGIPIREYASLCEESKVFWTSLLKKSDNKILVIEEVERLTVINQDLLFDAISTQNGLYGFEKKEFSCRLVFTSNLPINKLRDDRRFLQSRFFDRISQFVLMMPSFSTTWSIIEQDFKETWRKMDFKVKTKVPKVTPDMKVWLVDFAQSSHGNFRDLDKIVINWHNYRIEGNTDDQILTLIKKDFKEYLFSPSPKIDYENVFIFQRDTKIAEILQNFKHSLRKWSEIEYGNKHEAARALGMSVRTLERYV